LEGEAMGIWLELGIFGLVFVFAFWQMHDVRKAQEQTRQQRAREKEAKEALDQEAAQRQATDATDKKS
jgi:ABC-type nickel/cobalt efflux system permease component RcnA